MLSTLFLSLFLQMSAPELPGPYLVVQRDVTLVDRVFQQGVVRARVYYPQSSEGPFPLVNFMHGFLSRPSDHDILCEHIASYGFVVASTSGTSGFSPDTFDYAKDSRSILHAIEGLASQPGSWLEQIVEVGKDWAAIGHSMGGATLAFLVGLEPRVQTIIPLQPAAPESSAENNLRNFEGTSVWIAGSEDWICPPVVVRNGRNLCVSAKRNLYVLVQGMGHSGCTDSLPNNEPLPGNEQMDVHKRIVVSTLNAEMKGLEGYYEWVIGSSIIFSEPWTVDVQVSKPILVGGLLPTSLGYGLELFGPPNTNAIVAGSLGRLDTSLDMSDAIRLQNLQLNSNGTVAWSQFVPPSLYGQTIYAQALIADGTNRISQVLEIFVQ